MTKIAVQSFLVLAALSIFGELLLAQNTEVVTITEPGVYKLEDLFKESDVVALIDILSGDAENYRGAIYKTRVIQSFKGSQSGATVYLGPYLGLRIGEEYFVFLHNVAKPLAPKTTPTAGYGIISYAEIFNEGYTAMEASSACVFDGKSVDEKCDDGVRVCTDYIKLPKSLPAFPPEKNDPPFDCRWARRSLLVKYLDALATKK